MNIFILIRDFFRRWAFNAPQAAEVLDSVSALVRLALPVVAAVAAATPNRTDDQVLNLIANVGLPLQGYAADWLRNDKLVKDALRSAAVAMLRKQGITEPDSVINSAVELAYTIHKLSK
jgi:hypothetical protein